MIALRNQQAAAEITGPDVIPGRDVSGDRTSQFEQEFGDFLRAENIVDRLALDRAASAARTAGERLDRVLTKLGLVSEVNLAVALARFLSLDLAKPGDEPREPLLAALIEADFVRRNHILPLALDGDIRKRDD